MSGACSATAPTSPPPAPGQADADAVLDPCAENPGGSACVLARYDAATDGCAGDDVRAFEAAAAHRAGLGPAWHAGRALFLVRRHTALIAGDMNGWDATTTAAERVCSSDVFAADVALPSGHYAYKLVVDGEWRLDPDNRAFAYDGFSGNPEGRNSVLNTYDSGLGHLEQPATPLCSDALASCRPLTAYVPPGYYAPDERDRRYPVLFMHDGQNVFDDPDCCFGHTGWEINRTLDQEIAAGRVEPVVVVAFDHAGERRADEYAVSIAEGGKRETFMAFQVTTVQVDAARLWRLDSTRAYTAGSSLGGFISLALAMTYPDVYAGAASLSGSLWVGRDSNTSMFDVLGEVGVAELTLYLDHGGRLDDGADNLEANIEFLGELVAAGWTRRDVPACDGSPRSVCYFHDVGASHDELAWRGRSHHMLRALFSAPTR